MISQADKCLMAALLILKFHFSEMWWSENASFILIYVNICGPKALKYSSATLFVAAEPVWTHTPCPPGRVSPGVQKQKESPFKLFTFNSELMFSSQRVLARLYCLITFISPGCVHHSSMCVFNFPSYRRSWQPRSVIFLGLRLFVMPALDVIKENRLETDCFSFI